MNLYRLQYTETINRITYDRVEFFEGADNNSAITEANARFPIGTTSKKLYNIGVGVNLE